MQDYRKVPLPSAGGAANSPNFFGEHSRRCPRYKMKPVAWFSQIGMATVLLLLTMVGPAMDCLRPGTPLTQAEQACCKKMGPMCASSGVSVGHSCCKTVADGHRDFFTATNNGRLLTIDLGSSHVSDRAGAVSVVSAEKCLSFVSPSPPHRSLSSLQVFRL